MGDKEIEMVEKDGLDPMPKTLYKYRNWSDSNHKKLISRGELYYPSPSTFNDPFDCNLEISYNLLANNEDMRIQYFTDVVNKRYSEFSTQAQNAEVQNLIRQERYKDIDYLRRKHEESIKLLNKRFGVLSLTPIKDNILMWAHYANSHKGFCVGFDTELLYNQIGGGLKDVEYISNYPIISPIDNSFEKMRKQIFFKADFWNYELEYRHLKSINQSGRVYKLNKGVIKEVIIGYKMIESHTAKLIKTVKKYDSNIRIYKVMPSLNKFEFELKEI